MLFQEAVNELLSGKYLIRSSWTDGSYLVFLPGMTSVFKVIFQPNINVGNYLFLVEDFKADDWQSYNKREEVPPSVRAEVKA